MRPLYPTLAAVVAAIVCGTVHGVWTDRWQLSNEPSASAARISQINLNLEGWDGQVLPFTGNQEAGIAGTMHFRFTQKRTGRTVSVLLVCGRPGPVSIHSPDVCYGAVGYEVSKVTDFILPQTGEPAPVFHTARFRRIRAADTSDLRIFWGWSAGVGWQAPRGDPRLVFARYPALFKLYLIHEAVGSDETLKDDPAVDLMKQLLPELDRTLFTSS